jgi:hypothetical protein
MIVPDEGYYNLLTMIVPDEGYYNLLTMIIPDEGYSTKFDINVYIEPIKLTKRGHDMHNV